VLYVAYAWNMVNFFVICSDTSSRLHLPYVSCFPTVTARAVIGDEIAIILASGKTIIVCMYEISLNSTPENKKLAN
jgi:hypothetical protein